MTCSICPAVSPDAVERRRQPPLQPMCSPIIDASSFLTCETLALRSRICGVSTCFRLKARSCRVNGGTVASPANFLDVIAQHGVGRQLTEDEFRVAHDRSQQVVEVVGDAAGEPPDCFHLVGLTKFALGPVALRNVLDDRDEVTRLAGDTTVDADGQSRPDEPIIFRRYRFSRVYRSMAPATMALLASTS